MEISEREDGYFEDGTGRLFREVEPMDVVLDDRTMARLADVSERAGVPINDICQAAVVDRLVRESGGYGNG